MAKTARARTTANPRLNQRMCPDVVVAWICIPLDCRVVPHGDAE